MSLLEQIHTEHKARRAKFFNPPASKAKATPIKHPPEPVTAPDTKPHVRDWLWISTVPPHGVRVQDVIHAVASFYQVPIKDFMSKSRQMPLSKHRAVAMYLARELTGKSMPAIGNLLGGRDHTTVMHGIRKTKARMLDSVELSRDVEILTGRLLSVSRMGGQP